MCDVMWWLEAYLGTLAFEPPRAACSRNNIAAARLAGLERDLNLSSVEFQTAVSILFVG